MVYRYIDWPATATHEGNGKVGTVRGRGHMIECQIGGAANLDAKAILVSSGEDRHTR